MILPLGLPWQFKNQQFILLPQKALFWVDKKILIVADVHLGKVGHFRKAGIAIPKILEQEDLSTLSDIISEYHPETVLFLGDMFHSEMNEDWQWLVLWRELFPKVKMLLVRGNHDILTDHHYLDAGFALISEIIIGPFLFTHEPAKDLKPYYVISGHIHPGVKLYGKGRQNVTLPCYYFGASQAILPAFGRFTGCSIIKHNDIDAVFGILKHKVIKL